MNSPKQEDRSAVLESAATDTELLEKLEQYLQSCHPLQKEDGKKATVPFPNLAGFCRHLGGGSTEMELLQKSNPELYDRIRALGTAFKVSEINEAIAYAKTGSNVKTLLVR